MVQLCVWFKEEPSQFSVGQTAQSLTCSIVEKPHTGLDECPRILLSCFTARDSGPKPHLDSQQALAASGPDIEAQLDLWCHVTLPFKRGLRPTALGGRITQGRLSVSLATHSRLGKKT